MELVPLNRNVSRISMLSNIYAWSITFTGDNNKRRFSLSAVVNEKKKMIITLEGERAKIDAFVEHRTMQTRSSTSV